MVGPTCKMAIRDWIPSQSKLWLMARIEFYTWFAWIENSLTFTIGFKTTEIQTEMLPVHIHNLVTFLSPQGKYHLDEDLYYFGVIWSLRMFSWRVYVCLKCQSLDFYTYDVYGHFA